MSTKHQETPEERTFHQLVDKVSEPLSVAGRAVLQQAEEAASKGWMSHHYCYQTEEYEGDMKGLRRAAAELTEEDCEGLTKIWRSGLAAAASIDPDDYETPVGHRVYSGDLHGYYKMFSRLVEDVEREKRHAELRKKELAELEPMDDEDLPF